MNYEAESLPGAEPSQYDVFERVPPALAYLYKDEGATGLREALRVLISKPNPITRESLKEYAAELKAMRLPKVAAIVLEVAKDAPSKLDLCPWPDTPANVHNRRSWLWWERQKLGLCKWCGSDKSPEAICDNGETCVGRWRNLLARARSGTSEDLNRPR